MSWTLLLIGMVIGLVWNIIAVATELDRQTRWGVCVLLGLLVGHLAARLMAVDPLIVVVR